jgi:hypothetical protein
MSKREQERISELGYSSWFKINNLEEEFNILKFFIRDIYDLKKEHQILSDIHRFPKGIKLTPQQEAVAALYRNRPLRKSDESKYKSSHRIITGLKELELSPFEKEYTNKELYGILYLYIELKDKNEFIDDAIRLGSIYHDKIDKKRNNNSKHHELVSIEFSKYFVEIQDDIKESYEIDKEKREAINGDEDLDKKINKRLDWHMNNLITIKEKDKSGLEMISTGFVNNDLGNHGWGKFPKVEEFIRKYTKYYNRLYNKVHHTGLHNSSSSWRNKYEKYIKEK